MPKWILYLIVFGASLALVFLLHGWKHTPSWKGRATLDPAQALEEAKNPPREDERHLPPWQRKVRQQAREKGWLKDGDVGE